MRGEMGVDKCEPSLVPLHVCAVLQAGGGCRGLLFDVISRILLLRGDEIDVLRGGKSGNDVSLEVCGTFRAE